MTRVNQYNGGKYNRNSQYFDCIDTQVKTEIVGYLFADGNNYPPENKVQVRCSRKSEALLETINQELDYEKPIVRYNSVLKGKKYPSSAFILKDKNISSRLSDLGVVQNKSLVLDYPQWLSQEQHRWFISGYWQGDGICSMSSKISRGRWGCIGFIGTHAFLEKVNEALVDNDIHFVVSKRKNMSYLRTSSKREATRFYEFVSESVLKDPPKNNRFDEIIRRFYE